MNSMDGMAFIQAELAATKALLKEAIEVNDPVGVLQFKARIRELDDELLAFMEAT